MTLLKVVAIVAQSSKLLFFYNFQVSLNNACCKGQKVMGWANRRLGKLLHSCLKTCTFADILA